MKVGNRQAFFAQNFFGGVLWGKAILQETQVKETQCYILNCQVREIRSFFSQLIFIPKSLTMNDRLKLLSKFTLIFFCQNLMREREREH